MTLPHSNKASETTKEADFASTGLFRILLIGAKASIILFFVSALIRS
jgi:hypothetical protein